MVTRRPLPPDSPLHSRSSSNQGDFPTSPWQEDNVGTMHDRGHDDGARNSQHVSEATAPDSVPSILRPGNGGSSATTPPPGPQNPGTGSSYVADANAEVPNALKPGRHPTNPFLRKKVPSPQLTPTDTFAKLDIGEPIPNSQQPAADTFAKLDLDESGPNPWYQTPVRTPEPTGEPHPGLPQDTDTDPWAQVSSRASPQQPPPPIPQSHPPLSQEPDTDPWASPPRSPPLPPPQISVSPAIASLPSEDDSVWDDGRGTDASLPELPSKTPMSPELAEEDNVWDDLGAPEKGKAKAGDLGMESAQVDDWNLVDVGPSASTSKLPALDTTHSQDMASLSPTSAKEQLQQRWVPPREPPDGKTETYQVKNIRWHDAEARENPRTSPILVQNANGPCPLVALVNALTLTTPSNIPDTALVQTLRSREQVSLSLLLDAVFDELMSPRRTGSEDSLPDVSDLYSFLQSLHTGMNVNPRFIPTPEMLAAYESTTLTNLDASQRRELIPGTFESTMEMSLYATFSIPLIHGWLPPPSDPVYPALARQAASYEDVQNLLFREEELEGRLSSPGMGLSTQEQQLYQDILTIQSFLSTSATQLTARGIEVIGKAMRPGTFAILFRNDHFSTLYSHPQTKQLYALVTDAGYRAHEEVVWESLVDVNGERSEFLSGDFRPVGAQGAGTGTSAGNYSQGDAGEWTAVQGRRGNTSGPDLGETTPAPVASSTEQEDRDLALALQLQEEEDQRQREDEIRRQRESRLSEQYIEQQGRQPANATNNSSRTSLSSNSRNRTTWSNGSVHIAPERRSSNSISVPVTSATNRRTSSPSAPNNTTASNANTAIPRPTTQQVRPLVPPRRAPTVRADDGTSDAPPTYEQAQNDMPYEPPVGHPAHSSSSSVNVSRQTTRASVNSTASRQLPPQISTMGGRGPQQMGAGRSPSTASSIPGGYPGGRERDRDCVIM